MNQETEYKTKKVQISGFTENGREKEFLKTKERLAQEGWELVSFEDNGMSNTFATFKRPIGYKSTNKNTLKTTIIVSVIILVGWNTLSLLNKSGEKYINPKTELKPKISIETKNLIKGGFGNVLISDFTINNASDKPIKDIKIRCSLYAKSGTFLQTLDNVIFDIFPANNKKRIKEVNMGIMNTQTERVNCEVKDFSTY